MLKFIKHHMTSIIGIEVWPILAFVIFFTFFLGMLWYVLSFSRKRVAHMEQLPFTENAPAGLHGTANTNN
jgi:cbb3-type cytochrome oxidase subunit 3